MLTLPSYPDDKHPLLPKMKLLAWKLSGNHSACKIFQQKLSTSSSMDRVKGQRSNMDHISRDSFGTVLNGIRIPFMLLWIQFKSSLYCLYLHLIIRRIFCYKYSKIYFVKFSFLNIRNDCGNTPSQKMDLITLSPKKTNQCNYNRSQKLLRQTRKTAPYLKPQAIENSFKRAYGEVEDNIIIYIERLKT